MSETKLLPCPFCGSKAEETPAFIHCSSNTCPQGLWVKANNIAAWNTRPAPALTPKQEAADDLFEALTLFNALMDSGAWMLAKTNREPITNGEQDVIDKWLIKVESALAKAGRA